ncbi:unnamed protein product [Urochloa humidicola]
MLTIQSHFHTVPRGRLKERGGAASSHRDRARANHINAIAPRFLIARQEAAASAAGRRLAGHPLLLAAASASGTPQPTGPPFEDSGSSMSSAPLLGGGAKGESGGGGEPAAPPPSWLGRVVDVEEAREQLGFAVPMVLTSMAYYGIPLVSVMFSGHLGDVHLAGATLGNSWATVTGYAFVTGLSGALETLCGQAYGARLYRMLGLYLQSSLIMSAAVSVLVSALWWYTEPLLLFLRQDPEVSRAAAAFVRCQIPGLFAFSFLQCLLRYLQTQSVVLPLVVCSVAPFALHVALAHLLVNVLGLGLPGAAAAASATFWVSCIMLLAYVTRSRKFSETWKGFSADAFKYVLPTVKFATPSAVMVCLEYWAFELLVLIAGLLPNSTVSTSLIAMCSSTEAIAYMITFGFSAAVSTRVSNEIGAGNVERAKNAVSVTLKLSVFGVPGPHLRAAPGVGPHAVGGAVQRECHHSVGVRGDHAADDGVHRAGLGAGGALGRRQGMRVAAPGGRHQPGGVLLRGDAAGPALRLQARPPRQGTLGRAHLRPHLPGLRLARHHRPHQVGRARRGHEGGEGQLRRVAKH